MDRATLVALLVGAGISLVTTVLVEYLREWRTERRERKERQRATAEELQGLLIGLGDRLDDHKHAWDAIRATPDAKEPPFEELRQARKAVTADLQRMNALASRLNSATLYESVDRRAPARTAAG
jgi:hypothetical protein